MHYLSGWRAVGELHEVKDQLENLGSLFRFSSEIEEINQNKLAKHAVNITQTGNTTSYCRFKKNTIPYIAHHPHTRKASQIPANLIQ